MTLVVLGVTNASAYRIITPIPRDYAESVTPAGYVVCYETLTGYYGGIWSGAHRVCQYNMPDKELWIAGYWQCYQFSSRGICRGWKWVFPIWAKKEEFQLKPDVNTRSGWHTGMK
jgi:hypothetical protein